MTTPEASPGDESRKPPIGRTLGVIFTGLIGLVCWVFFFACAGMTIRDLRTYWWQEAPATLTKCEVVEQSRGGGKSRFVLNVDFSFEWQGRRYDSDRYSTEEKQAWDHLPLSKIKAQLEASPQLRCYVDPSAVPPRAVLVRGEFAGPIAFALLSLGGALLMTKLFRLVWRSGRSSVEAKAAQSPSAKASGRRWEIWGDAIAILITLVWAFNVRSDTIIKPRLEADRARDWIETPCVILWSRLATATVPISKTYAADICYRYTFGGREYTASGTAPGKYPSESRETQKAFAESYREGQQTTCWVNPRAPYEAWLRREPVVAGADRFFYSFLFVLAGAIALHAIAILRRRPQNPPPV